MRNSKKAAFALIIAVLFATLIIGIEVYYGGKVNASNAEITSLNSQAANQTSQIATLTSQVTLFNSEAANLTSHLEVSEATKGTNPYDALSINGTVVNTGNLTAYNAGLKVTAYSASGTLEINITVPLVPGDLAYFPSTPYISSDILFYGTDNATQAYANNRDTCYGETASLQLEDLSGGEAAPVNIEIFHEGTAANWNVTTVWTKSSQH